MSRAKRCCCVSCPPGTTKESLGLPDELTANLSGATLDATGIPSDEVIGDCSGNDIYARWTASNALIAAIASFTVDYESQEATQCCFVYGRDGTDDGCGNSGTLYELGPNPFSPTACGDEVQYGYGGDNVSGPDGPDPGTDNCCWPPSAFTCTEVVGTSFAFNDGTVYDPRGFFGRPSVRICVNGQTVSIGITIAGLLTWNVTEGTDCAYESANLYGGLLDDPAPPFWPDCEPRPASVFCTGGATTCESVGVTIQLNANQDLSGVSGATIWDKIQAATWEFEYTYSVCDLGGCCINERTTAVKDCEISDNCFWFGIDPADVTIENDVPVDQQCLYGNGTVTVSFS